VQDNSLIIEGNLTRDLELRHTPGGTPVVTLRLAHTPRRYDRGSNGFVDVPSVFLDVTVWREQAENVAASVRKGDRVLVVGRLRQRTFSVEGVERTVHELEADAVAVDLSRAVARPMRVRRDQPGRVPAGLTESASESSAAGSEEPEGTRVGVGELAAWAIPGADGEAEVGREHGELAPTG